MRITPFGASAILVTVLTSSAAFVLMRHRSSSSTKPGESPDGKSNGHDLQQKDQMKQSSQTTRTNRATAQQTEKVYVTENGTRYHRNDCRLVKVAKTAIALDEARGSYQPCKVCLPPV